MGALGFGGGLVCGGGRRPFYVLSFRPLRVHVFPVGLCVGGISYLCPIYFLGVLVTCVFSRCGAGGVSRRSEREVLWVARVRALVRVEFGR